MTIWIYSEGISNVWGFFIGIIYLYVVSVTPNEKMNFAAQWQTCQSNNKKRVNKNAFDNSKIYWK